MVDVAHNPPTPTNPEQTGAANGTTAALAGTAFRTASDTWASGRTRTLDWRARQLEGVEQLVTECEDELVAAMSADFGKPRVEAWLADLLPVANEARHARRSLRWWTRPRWTWPGMVNLPGSAWTVAEPLGTVLVISPWNYPVNLALTPVVAAVAAGNAVVLKPSELTPATSAALAQLVPRYLDPDGVVVVEGNADTASALLEQPFDHIFFTGSPTVGRVVMAAAAKQLASVTLELGGKSPVIVTADADVPVAARRIAWGKLLNAGQTCIAPDYVLADRAVADRLLEALPGALARMEGADPSATRTRIVNGRHLERLAGLLEHSGGRLVTGGGVDPQRGWIEPTVVADPDPESALMQEEIFGPVLPVLRVDGLDDAIRFVNARPKPLALYLFSGSREAERRVLAETTAGGTCLNHVLYQFVAPGLPFGGVGNSGTGAYHGRRGFEELSHRKPVVRRSVRVDPPFGYPPYDAWKEKLIRRLL